MPLLEARGLSVRGPRGLLLAPSTFTLHEGERVLLVGPSGSGKSLLLDVLLGFVPHERRGLSVGGSLRLEGRELLEGSVEERDGLVGAVFQLQASGLFDDLSAAQNLAFGEPDPVRAAAQAQALGLGGLERPMPWLSGGEQMRLSIARTLLRQPTLLAVDEPTTGLDPASARQVVEALLAAHRRLTLVVTHDAAAFEGFADLVLRLDPLTKTVAREAPDPRETPVRATSDVRPPRKPGLLTRLARGWADFAASTTDVLLDAASLCALPRAAFDARHALHGPRVRRALARSLAPGVAAFVGLAAVLVALTATFFLFDRLPRREFTEPVLQEDLLSGLGLILSRVVVPLVTSILLAAKLGASVAAHLGHLTRSRQVDALRLLGVPPRRHLLQPTALGLLASAWLHTLVAVLLAGLTTVVVFLWQHSGWSGLYAWRAWFQGLDATDALWVAAKTGTSSLFVALTAYRFATRPKRGPEDVLAGIHRTLLVGLILVLAAHAAFAFLEF